MESQPGSSQLLDSTLNTILAFMKANGLIFRDWRGQQPVDSSEELTFNSSSSKQFTIGKSLLKVYCIAVNILHVLGCIRFTLCFNRRVDLSSESIIAVSIYMWLLFSAYVSISMSLIGLWKFHHVEKCLLYLYKTYPRKRQYAMKLMRFVTIITIFAVCVILSSIGIGIYILLLSETSAVNSYWLALPFAVHSFQGQILVYIGFIHFIYILANWYAVAILYASFCYILYHEFKYCSSDMENIVTKDQSSTTETQSGAPTLDRIPSENFSTGDSNSANLTDGTGCRRCNMAQSDGYNDQLTLLHLETVRTRYGDVLRLTNAINSILSHYVLISLFVSIPVICIHLYGVAKLTVWKEAMAMVASEIFWMFVHLLLIIGGGILVNQEAHCMVEYLFGIGFVHNSAKVLQSISIFVSRLTTMTNGISAGGLFIIDKAATITLVGTLLTYSVVVFQFSSTTDNPVPVEVTNNTTLNG